MTYRWLLLLVLALSVAPVTTQGAEADFFGTYSASMLGCELQLSSDHKGEFRWLDSDGRARRSIQGRWVIEEQEIVFTAELFDGVFARRFLITSASPPELSEHLTVDVPAEALEPPPASRRSTSITFTVTYKRKQPEPKPVQSNSVDAPRNLGGAVSISRSPRSV